MANYTSNGVTFNNVKAGINTGGQKLTKSPYKYDENGNIVNPQQVINAIDIDWCQATVTGLSEPISSTAQLLSKVGEMNQNIEKLNGDLESVQETIGGTGEESIFKRIDTINEAIEELHGALESVQETIGGTSEESIFEIIDTINEAIESLQQNIGGTGEGSISERMNKIDNAIEELQQNIGGTGEGSIAERMDEIDSAIEELQQNIGGTGEGSIAERMDEIDSAIEELQQNIGGTGEGSINDRVDNNASDINEIKRQIQAILNGQAKISGHVEHVILTEAEYEALGIKDQNTVYFITDEEGESGDEEEDPISTALYVNGTLVTDANVTLVPGRIYTLEGSVVGTITVDASNINDPTNLENTEIRLKGVKVLSPENYGIRYLTPVENKGYKDLVITLEKNTKNYVVCTEELDPADDQPGAVYSMNNLTIQGAGYLAVHNTGGHGIRGTEVKLLGSHIYADVNHDAIHGKKMWVCGGTYYIDNANDAFGTSIGGSIKYSFGDIYVNELNGKVFNAKSGEEDGVQVTGTVISVETPHIVVLKTNTTYESTAITPITSLYDTCTVKEYDTIDAAKQFSLSGTPISDSTGMYIATKPFITIEGYVTKPINIPNGLSDATIFLADAVIYTNQVTSGQNLINEPSIAYDSTSSNIKIQTVKDTFNVIINNCPEWVDGQDADAVKSEHNIKVEIKNDSYLYINAKSGDGLDGTDVNITDSKGILMIHKCGERAIKGNNIIIGPSASTPQGSITLITDVTSADYTTFDGAVIATENCVLYGPQLIRVQASKIAPGSGYADIFARKGKAMDKGSFILTAAELNGIIICNTLGATISINADNSANLYYNELYVLDQVTQTNIPAPTVEQYIAYPYKKTPISK